MSDSRNTSLQPNVAPENENEKAAALQNIIAQSRARREALLEKSKLLTSTNSKFQEVKEKIASIKALEEEKRKREEEAKEVGLHEKLPAILLAKRRRVDDLNAQLESFKSELENISASFAVQESNAVEDESPANDETPDETLHAFKRRVTDLITASRKNDVVKECNKRYMGFFESKLSVIDALDERLKGENEEAASLLEQATALLNKTNSL